MDGQSWSGVPGEQTEAHRAPHLEIVFYIYKPFQLLKQLEYSPSGVQVAEVYGWAVMVWCARGADGSPPRSTS